MPFALSSKGKLYLRYKAHEAGTKAEAEAEAKTEAETKVETGVEAEIETETKAKTKIKAKQNLLDIAHLVPRRGPVNKHSSTRERLKNYM